MTDYALTTDHPASSHKQPVMIIDGVPYGPSDKVPWTVWGPKTCAQWVSEDMEYWARSVRLALGFGPWRSTAKRNAPPHDPALAEAFCRLGGIEANWGALQQAAQQA